MNETFECGDTGALVAYLYEECEPEIRDVIATHLIRCESCSNEVDGLGWTRRRLQAWTPPVAELGFQMLVPLESLGCHGGARRSRHGHKRSQLSSFSASACRWVWHVVQEVRYRRCRRFNPSWPRRTRHRARTSLNWRSVCRSEMAQMRTAGHDTGVRQATSSDDDIMKKVEALVAQSEERQRREFTLRSVEMARDFEAQRRIDMASVRETVGQFQGAAGTEIRQQREAIDRINNFIRVSQQGSVATISRGW